MISRYSSILLIVSILSILNSIGYSGTTGALWGTVTDRLTGKVIAGATVKVEPSNHRSMSDKDGTYAINQLPPGDYNLRVMMIGYLPIVISNIMIKTDTRNRVDILMTPDFLETKEDRVVPPPKTADFPNLNQYHKDTHLREMIPLKTIEDILSFQLNNQNQHLRNGRQNEVLYLVDGLPMHDLFFRNSKINLPRSSLADVTIYSHGFEAEFGQAMSGMVNITTQEGKNKNNAFFNLCFDNFAGLAKNDNTNRLEWNWNGPVVLGFGGPVINLNCLFGGKIELTDTPWPKEMSKVFQAPVNRDYSLIGKFNFQLLPNLRVGVQGIYSKQTGREYDYFWKYNLWNLPENEWRNHRTSIMIRHEPTTNLFYTFQLLHYETKTSILGPKTEVYSPLKRMPDNFSGWVIDGQAQWWERIQQLGNIFKLDLVNYLTQSTHLKLGAEFHYFNLSMNNRRFQEVPKMGDHLNYGYILEKNDFNQLPYILASYFQTNFIFSDFQANIGFRFDAFDARLRRGRRKVVIYSDRQIILPDIMTIVQARISPRINLTLALTSKDYLILNYGWFYQMPPLYCFYKNLDHSFEGYFPIIGNPELEHEKTILYELNYQRRFSEKLSLLVTTFQKDISHLTGTKIYYLTPSSGSALTRPNPLAYAQYVNIDRGTVNSLELSFNYQPNKWIHTRFGYALSKATGTASYPEERYHRMIWGIEQSEDEVPLAWDQRHSFIGMIKLGIEKKWGLYFWAKLGSPLPYPAFDIQNGNQSRFNKWQSYFALKANFSFNSFVGRISPFVEITNIFDTQNFIGFDTNNLPYNFSMDDPTLYIPDRRIFLGINYHFQ